jgi:thiol-disulfide isomerase/thioredoxin
MKRIFIIGLYSLLFFTAYSQDSGLTKENPFEYFNNFQKYRFETPNADSAFYFVKKLASNHKYIGFLRNLIHDSFAQEFLQRKGSDASEMETIKRQQLLSNQVLAKIIADTTISLRQTIRPMYLWKTIQDNKGNIATLSDLTTEFMNTEISSGDIYTNRTGRYALMICQIISPYPELKPLAERLFAQAYSNLEKNQLAAPDSSSKTDLNKRAWYRYLYAYSNYVKSTQTDKLDQKELFLKKAFDYSPDSIDRNHYSAYFYDMEFLFDFEEKPTFKLDYISLLTSTGTDTSSVLAFLLKTALIEPEYKSKLKEFYNKNHSSPQDFESYWRDAVNAHAQVAPPIYLPLLDEKSFSSKNNLGKWTLVDFWGTWCAPCRAEHPEMQKFYDSVVLKNSPNICLLTIACRDTKEKVLAYLKEKQFTFPVAMSDSKIENIYPVQGYPAKFLITPEGKYLTVPYGIDWISFVKQYCSLE